MQCASRAGVHRFAVVVALVAVAAPAHALKPRVHADLARTSCVSAGLPNDFCQRVATEDYNTDADEWDDLVTHAQIDGGQTACDAADKATGRVWLRAFELRAAIDAIARDRSETRVGDAAELVGRVVHTIQDNCAHHGMPNPQHAWFSLGDFCDGTSTSPDVEPAAIECARRETDAVMRSVADAVRASDVSRALADLSCPDDASSSDHGAQQQPICQRRYLPGPFDACQFLGQAKQWDGVDRTWNNDVVTAALRDAFAAGLAGRDALPGLCRGDERVLSSAASEPMVDVSGGPPSCTRAHLLCFGGADGDDSPFADDPATDDAGCRSTRSPTGAVGLGLIAALAILRRRR
jgi:hypothetical protein